MDYEKAVATAPPGWRFFDMDDVARLPAGVRERELSRIPPGEPPDRVLRGLFWTLVYHLEPQRWDELSRCEPIHPAILDELPRDVRRGLDVGAGSGRLTAHLVTRCESVVAVEPSAGLRTMLAARFPAVRVEPGWADALPFDDAAFDLVASCGVPDLQGAALGELRRVAMAGGWIALISPEDPEWFEARGWRRVTTNAIPPEPHPAWIDDFFGRPDPPHELVLTRRG